MAVVPPQQHMARRGPTLGHHDLPAPPGAASWVASAVIAGSMAARVARKLVWSVNGPRWKRAGEPARAFIASSRALTSVQEAKPVSSHRLPGGQSIR
jgi:hypothetical protein